MDLSKYVSFEKAGKAITSAGAVVVGGAITKVILKIIGHNWPWFIDSETADAVDDIIAGMLAYIGAYVPNQPGGKS